jgi:hypothetical protein
MNYFLQRLLQLRLSGERPLALEPWPLDVLCEARRDFVHNGRQLYARKFRRGGVSVPDSEAGWLAKDIRPRERFDPEIDEPGDRIELAPEEARRLQKEGLVTVLGPQADRFRCGAITGWRPWHWPPRNIGEAVRFDGEPVLRFFDEVWVRVQTLGQPWSGIQICSGLILEAGSLVFLPFGVVRTFRYITEIEPIGGGATFRIFLDEVSPFKPSAQPAAV